MNSGVRKSVNAREIVAAASRDPGGVRRLHQHAIAVAQLVEEVVERLVGGLEEDGLPVPRPLADGGEEEAARVAPHHDDALDAQPHGEQTDAVVLLAGELAELAHGTEDGDLPLARARDLRERAQRGRHRVGARVVGVVDDAHAVGAERLHPPALRDLERLQPRDGGRQRHAELAGGRQRGQRVHDVVLAEHAEPEREALVPGHDRARRAGGRDLDVLGPDLRGGAATEPADLDVARRGDGRHRDDASVVRVQHRDTAGADRLDQLGLRLQCLLDAAEAARVGQAHHQHDTHVRGDQTGQTRDLAGSGGAELADEEAGLRADAQHRQRRADLVVERAARRDGVALVLQDARQHVLGGGLAVRAGDADDPQLPARADGGHDHPREVGEGRDGIRDDDLADGRVDASLHDRQHRTGLDGGLDEVVAVGDLAGFRDEDVTRPDHAGVGVDVAVDERLGSVVVCRVQSSRHGGGHLGQRHPDHRVGSSRAVARRGLVIVSRAAEGCPSPRA